MVFLTFLLFAISKKLIEGSNKVVQTVEIIDRKYLQTWSLLKDRPLQKLERYHPHITKIGVFSSKSDPTLCLQASKLPERANEVVTVNKCVDNSMNQVFTMDRYRNSG